VVVDLVETKKMGTIEKALHQYHNNCQYVHITNGGRKKTPTKTKSFPATTNNPTVHGIDHHQGVTI